MATVRTHDKLGELQRTVPGVWRTGITPLVIGNLVETGVETGVRVLEASVLTMSITGLPVMGILVEINIQVILEERAPLTTIGYTQNGRIVVKEMFM